MGTITSRIRPPTMTTEPDTETAAMETTTAQEHHDHRRSHDVAAHAGHAHDDHGGHDKHAGHDPEMFRRRFWLSLILTIPLVVTGEMVMDWFNYSLDFWGMDLLGPVLGSIVFWWAAGPSLPAASPRC